MPRVAIRLRMDIQAKIGLDQNQIVQTALKLLDEVGLDSLTMRRLAERLNIKAASLYWHVRDKDELIVLLANEICAPLESPDPALSWREQIEQFAHGYRRILLTHRDAARVLQQSGPPSGDNRLRWVETWLATLLKTGLSKKDATFAAIFMNDYVTEFVLEETRYAVPPAEQNASSPGDPGENWIGVLPRDQYPTIAALADHLINLDMDEQFRFGIEVFLDGLEKRLRPPE